MFTHQPKWFHSFLNIAAIAGNVKKYYWCLVFTETLCFLFTDIFPCFCLDVQHLNVFQLCKCKWRRYTITPKQSPIQVQPHNDLCYRSINLWKCGHNLVWIRKNIIKDDYPISLTLILTLPNPKIHIVRVIIMIDYVNLLCKIWWYCTIVLYCYCIAQNKIKYPNSLSSRVLLCPFFVTFFDNIWFVRKFWYTLTEK